MAAGLTREAQGMFKDVSLTPILTQIRNQLSQLIRLNIPDTYGCLHQVLERRVMDQHELLLNNTDRPQAVLLPLIHAILSSDQQLAEFVREIDQLYGQSFGERPYFQRIGQMPDSRDPYTHQSVREALKNFESYFAGM